MKPGKRMWFANRQEAGQRLAAELLRFVEQNPVVLALPRGGVPVGFEIAMKLSVPLDVVLVRKIGHPSMPELAVGAIADGEKLEKVIDEKAIAELGVSRAYLDQEIARQAREIEHRRQLYFKGRGPTDIRHRTALVVDDGIATGATMRAALRAVRQREPAKVVLAVPVAPASALESLGPEADEIVCLSSPEEFGAVGAFYADFRPVEDEIVVALLDRAAANVAKRALTASPAPTTGSERP
jgi:putative phosphoribosyl transferase